ncbi:MAG: LacI family DNA-binding transcriptional regulator [Pseudomonadota bacterium]
MKSPKVINTLQGLADIAGVSRATASRALNDSPLISDKTKQRIQALAEQHRYSLNTKARDFRLQRSNLVSVIFMLDIPSKQHMSDPFFLEMLGAVADCLAEHDYDLLLAHAPVTDALALGRTRVLQQADGLIFLGQGTQHRELNDLALSEKPMVVWGGQAAGRRYTLVGGDNHQGGFQVTQHLLSLGRKKVAFFGNLLNPEIRARHQGYERALSVAGVEPMSSLRKDVPFQMQEARHAVIDFLHSGVDVDAIVCASDVMALATIATLQSEGIAVPGDIAVTGYDDIALASYSNPPLTTVRQNIQWSGRVLVETVLSQIRGETASDTTVSSQLQVRESCGAAAST